MKKAIQQLLTLLALLLPSQLWAANTKTTVEQVTTTVTLTDDVDYIITSATPFGDEGVVNIENTDHAVLILKAVKPSKANSILSKHVLIGGAKAVNNSNCQVKLYNRGCIILPYGNSVKPLTVYSEQNFEGDECNDFGLEHSGGFMNTLSDKKLNNRIRSFKLKRGYMVTFSLRNEGRGYSRCFIAADADLEMATLPAILDRSISSYRIFKWYDAGKPQLAAAAGDNNACSALNVTSTYTWSAGSSMLPDQECVTHQIYSTWPSPSSLGNANYTCHMKTSNEPRNSSDDHPETLADILKVWEELMRTGMRLCSPSSWDGSDYWNGTGFLKEFFDSIDARGWRCDIVDLHCYWPEGNFGNVRNWTNSVHRPVWISEWCWGASWNNDGAFANGVTQNQVRDALQRICNNLNSYDCVERYFYWNSERDISRIYRNGSLTPAGQMYSQLDGGLAYNGKYDYVPRAPKQHDPKDLVVDFNKETNTIDFMWYEYNGEMNEYIHLERRENASKPWTVVMDITGIEQEGLHIKRGVEARQGWQFRIAEKDANGTERRTKAVTAASGDMQPGDAVNVGEQTLYLGGNVVLNGDFDMGLAGWTNGKGQPLASPWFQTPAAGGSDGNAYLQSYGHSTQAEAEQSVRTIVDIQPGAYYYLSASVCNLNNIFNLISLTGDEAKSDSLVMMLDNGNSTWLTQFATFNNSTFNKVIFAFRSLGSKSQFDDVKLCRLFATPEEAYADGALKERERVMLFAEYANASCALTELLEPYSDDPKLDYEYVHNELSLAIEANDVLPRLYALCADARNLTSQYQLPGYEDVNKACETVEDIQNRKCLPKASEVLAAYEALQSALEAYMPMETLTDKVEQPNFASAAGWLTKAGTYQGGDQRVNQKGNVSFWNAWWNLPKEANEQQTMAIRQEVKDLTHGLYAVECQAATEHFCLSDQHGYISNGTDSIATPVLTADFMDLPTVAEGDVWQTLTSQPIYIADGQSAFIGFEGSKQGANDLTWRELGNNTSKGDHREGWWGATNFRLRYHPLYRVNTTPGAIGVCCLAYDVAPVDGVTFYQIAAITPDYQTLCLEPIQAPQAGVPFLYVSTKEVTTFVEQGQEVTITTDGPGNLRGFLKMRSTITRVPKGYYVLTDGKWQKVGDERPYMQSFTGIIRPFNDKASKPLTVVSSWDGLTMPIVGVTQEEIEASVGSVVNTNDAQQTVYDLQGRKVEQTELTKGIYIINNKKHIVR
ncbi:MAG: hypothetical protein J5552_05050 [Prevotella sp.]|nr:hypothetical protein [Prevotella sp.]